MKQFKFLNWPKNLTSILTYPNEMGGESTYAFVWAYHDSYNNPYRVVSWNSYIGEFEDYYDNLKDDMSWRNNSDHLPDTAVIIGIAYDSNVWSIGSHRFDSYHQRVELTFKVYTS